MSHQWRAITKRRFLLLIPVIILIYYNYPSEKDPILVKYEKNNTKIILYWQKFFNYDDMSLGLGSDIFRHCPISNCLATTNKSLMEIDEFDAIVFHGAQYHKFFSWWKYGKPNKRSNKQVYIFFTMEAPTATNIVFKGDYNFYNWTMTYRFDSDVQRPYGYLIKGETNYTMPSVKQITKRKKKIAWFVSNCDVDSKRDLLYKRIQQFFPVDVYGACGNFSCPVQQQENCYKMLEDEYKFYLSFENSICNDYVTEKMYKLLKYNVIPIVFGGANYSIVAPPQSVVNVMDFKTIEDFIKYIKWLDNNPEEYLKYFQWKKHYEVRMDAKRTVCELCKKLNENGEKTVYDIYDWVWGLEQRESCKNDWIDKHKDFSVKI